MVAVQRSFSPSRFLELPALSALAHMRFATRHRIEGAYSGRHQSRQRGGAAEFVDYREYSAGEDLRRLDWKVLARTGRPYLRLYQDETNLLCTMVLDASASMLFGGTTGKAKLEYIQYLATALSHVISRQQDQVGLALAAERLMDFLPPGGTPSHIRRVQDLIANLQTHPATDLGESLRDLFGRVSRRGVLMVMSDFLVDDLEQTFSAVRMFRHRRWEVIVLHIVHPEEEELPQGLAYRFEGLENDGRVDCTPHDVRRAYQERFEHHAALVRGMSLGAGCDYRRVLTSVPYLQTLGGFLVERAG
jgi:uncharacterized protein (DUF58 family)